MSQPPQRKGLNIAVLIALIAAIAPIVAAAIEILPDILAKDSQKPDATITAQATAVNVAATPAATAQPPVAPTAVASLGAPVAVGGYPCDATVSYWQAGTLNVVRDFPNDGALLRDTISVGTSVQVIDISGTSLPWYRIASQEGRMLGWIPAEYLALSTACPHP